MSKYLYGASVQGIQDFIFKTNQLQEIVGASEIVKSLEREFVDFAEIAEDKILLNAAGNIKAIFEDKGSLERVVKEFPKLIMQKAYGITISQAVVVIDGEFGKQDDAIRELERKLKIQKNKPSIPLDLSIGIMELAPKTARALFRENKKQKSDIATAQKRDAYAKWFREKRKSDKKFVNLKEMSVLANKKHKLAVIHADGNGLGQIVLELGDKLSGFSTKLNTATQNAFKNAKIKDMKVRDIILGGDDMTVICDANYALEFTKNFLYQFEEETKKIEELKSVGFDKLTACAGIAYCNEKYPFHYAVSLAEALCGATKKHAKKLVENTNKPAPSSLMFHNIQSSNFQSWEKFIADELTILSPTDNEPEVIRCDFGPYYLSQDGEPKIQDFIHIVEGYRCEDSPISRLREWIGELHKSQTYADNLLQRINKMVSQNSKWDSCIMDKNLKNLKTELSNEKLIIDKDGMRKTPIYDVLQILSVTEAK